MRRFEDGIGLVDGRRYGRFRIIVARCRKCRAHPSASCAREYDPDKSAIADTGSTALGRDTSYSRADIRRTSANKVSVTAPQFPRYRNAYRQPTDPWLYLIEHPGRRLLTASSGVGQDAASSGWQRDLLQQPGRQQPLLYQHAVEWGTARIPAHWRAERAPNRSLPPARIGSWRLLSRVRIHDTVTQHRASRLKRVVMQRAVSPCAQWSTTKTVLAEIPWRAV